MRKITKPIVGVRKVIEDCIDNLTDKNLKKELLASLNIFEAAENEFDTKKKTYKLHLISRNAFISAIVNEDILKSIYTKRFVNKKNLGRIHYDNIFLSAPNGKCPLCSQRIVTTLDHYLPKAKYALLSVSPLNLIPSCTDCNKGKLADYPTNSEEETLHPYYDDIENENWLKLQILKINPIIFNFFVSPPKYWNSLLQNRVEYHFHSFKLNELYKSHAAEEFENIKFQLTKLYQNGGPELLKEHLGECLESRKKININSWQTAFYEGLITDINFCNGAFI